MGRPPQPVPIEDLCRQLRVDILRCTQQAGSGHPTSSLSAVELGAVLFSRHLRYDISRPDHPGADKFVLSKGHATPLLYALYRAIGAIDEKELLTYRRQGSRLEGHPTPRLPWVEAATGSLGQGLPIGVGFALAARMAGIARRTYVLCGDSEMSEGSMWEAAEHAGHDRLDRLTAIVDVNRLGQRGPTRHEWDLDAYARRFAAFGWETLEVDGHDPDEIDAALAKADSETARPTAILARTVKGKGVPEAEDEVAYHGKSLDQSDEAIERLGGPGDLVVTPAPPLDTDPPPGTAGHAGGSGQSSLPRWEPGDEAATRGAYGEALVALGRRRPDVVALDGEVSNSTRADGFAREIPERFIEAYIAEQNMLGMAIGLARSGYHPFVSTFAAFLSRAYDFIRMAPVSGVDLTLVGSHAGVSIGPDGPSQMGLEDIAALRAVAGATVLYPCDANQTRALTDVLADVPGVGYLRTTRGATPVIYRPADTFEVGGSRTLRHSDQDRAVIVAAGITVHEALAAADDLGQPVSVIDAYSIQPLDAGAIARAAAATGRVVTVEDHRAPGGLGEAVAGALLSRGVGCRFRQLAVEGVPASATPEEQLELAGIGRSAITAAVEAMLE
ncbi:MAG: transketolase [Actinomycetota bacterium]